MVTYIVATVNGVGEDIILKRTEDFNEAQDYYDQCVRGSERYQEREPNAPKVTFKLYEIA